MFLKILLKEWRENILVFLLAILFMIALVVLTLTDLRELTLNFSGMFLLLFLPFAALLIGSGGFYSEFKDNAWIYLFSRPIKKELLWLFKYISLLSILVVIFLLFLLVKQFLPGLDEILNDIKFPSEFRGILSFSLYFVIPLIAFTISFSISILYDKQFIIFFVSILIGAALALLFRGYLSFLYMTYYYYGGFRIFGLFVVLSFILASVITFVKSDFSQMGRKFLMFTKFVMLFIVISLALGTIGIARGDLFTGSKRFYPYYSVKHEGDLYVDNFSHGIVCYKAESDKVKKMVRTSDYMSNRHSIEGDKIAFLKYAPNTRYRWDENLWVINTDGSEEKVLVETDNPDTPFYKCSIWGNCLLSPDGSRVIFLTGVKNRKSKINEITVWWMNTDGTGIQKKILEFPLNYTEFHLVAWPVYTDDLILLIEEKSPTFKKVADRLLLIDLDKETHQILLEDVRTLFEYLRIGYHKNMYISPTHDYLVLVWEDRLKNQERLVLLDLKTLEKRIILEADSMRLYTLKWSQDGKKIVFSRARETLVYTLADGRLRTVSKRDYGYEIGFDWLADGKRLALIIPDYGDLYLRVLGEDFKEEKKIKIPYPVEESVFLWGLDNKVLMNFNRRSLFRLDLETEKWKKVY